jgi:hypothetical protein
MAVSNKIGKQTRTKISSKIDGIAGLPAKCSTETKYQEKQPQGDQVASAQIGVVLEGEYDEDEHGACYEFRKEHSRRGEKRLRIGGKDSGGRCLGVSRHCSDASPSFVCVDRRLVVPINNSLALVSVIGAEDEPPV